VAEAVERERVRLHPGARPTDGRQRAVAAARQPAPAVATRDFDGVAAGGRRSRQGPALATRGPKLSKDAYRRQREVIDAELTRLGLRKNHLELAVGDPAVRANFVELRRISSELADVESALAVAEDAWLALEERAP
jgi:hypothetical protein